MYGSLQVWLSRLSDDERVKQRFCRAWLCPEEFSGRRTFGLLQQNTAGPTRPLAELQRALQFDSASAYKWANLGEAEINLHRKEQASYCFERALAAGPGNPAVLFRAANFEFQTGDERAGLKNLSAILRNPELSDYYQPAFLTYRRMNLSLDEILNAGIPKVSTAAEPFLDFWIKDNRASEAAQTWKWMADNGLSTDKAAGSYVAFLVRSKQEDLAAEQWATFNRKDSPNYRQSNWAFNGSFEWDPKPGPFDWHIESTHGVEASRVEDTAFEGRNALRLVFAGNENVNYNQSFEETVVSPGIWKIRAALKVDGITSDQGVAVRVSDAEQPNRLDITTEPLTGTTGWVSAEKTFPIEPATKLVRLEVVRRPSRKYEGRIAGTAWIDGVKLIPIH